MNEKEAQKEGEKLKSLANDVLQHVDLGEIKHCAVVESEFTIVINYQLGELQIGSQLSLNSIFTE